MLISEETSGTRHRIYPTDGGARGGIPPGDDGEDEQVPDGARRQGHPGRLERRAGQPSREEEGKCAYRSKGERCWPIEQRKRKYCADIQVVRQDVLVNQAAKTKVCTHPSHPVRPAGQLTLVEGKQTCRSPGDRR